MNGSPLGAAPVVPPAGYAIAAAAELLPPPAAEMLLTASCIAAANVCACARSSADASGAPTVTPTNTPLVTPRISRPSAYVARVHPPGHVAPLKNATIPAGAPSPPGGSPNARVPTEPIASAATAAI